MSGETDAPSDSDPADLLPLLVELSSHKAAAARTAPPGTGHRDAGGETQQPGNSSAAPGPADEELKPRYAELNMWVTEWFAPVIERRLQSGRGSTPGLYWCEFWWDHPEAIFRLYAIWREWEKARAGDTMSAWARDHLDPHLAVLTSELGPFGGCEPGSDKHEPIHVKRNPLPVKPAPSSVLSKLPDWERKDGAAVAAVSR